MLELGKQREGSEGGCGKAAPAVGTPPSTHRSVVHHHHQLHKALLCRCPLALGTERGQSADTRTLRGARPLGDLPSVARAALLPLAQGGRPACSSGGPAEGGMPCAALGGCWCLAPACSSWCLTARGARWGRTEELGYGAHPIISTRGVGSQTAGLGGSPESSAGTEVGPGAGEALHCSTVAAVLLQQGRGLRIQPQAGVPLGNGDSLGTQVTAMLEAIPAVCAPGSPVCRRAGNRAVPQCPAPAPCQRLVSPTAGTPSSPCPEHTLAGREDSAPPTLPWVHPGAPTPAVPWMETGN